MKKLELNSYSHGYGQITYHIVLVPKYRHKIFYGSVMKADCEKVIRGICDRKGYKVVSIHIGDDHVHLFLEFHPTDTLSGVIKQLKGESAVLLFRLHPELRKKLWNGNLWSAGKFYRSVGNVTADTIKHYINESQQKPVTMKGPEQASLRQFLK